MRTLPLPAFNISPFQFKGTLAFKDHQDGRIEKALQDQYPSTAVQYRGDIVTLSVPDGDEAYIIKQLKMTGQEVHSTDDFAAIMGAKDGTVTAVPEKFSTIKALEALYGKPYAVIKPKWEALLVKTAESR